MKLKLNIVGLLAMGVLASPAFFTSCSEDAMDKVNENVNKPNDVQAKFILTDVITRTAFYNTGGDFNTYLSVYVEHEVGTDNQLWNAERREREPQSASTFNNTWGNMYTALKDARMVIEKCSPGGPQEGNNTTLGMGQVMAAYNLALLTDMFGDVPYAEGFKPLEIRNPKLDKQEELYKQVNAYLDAAIENLPKGDTHATGSVGGQDLLYSGNTQNWLKFAYGLKARYGMRLVAKSTDKSAALKAVIANVDKSFKDASEQAAFDQYAGSNRNPFFDFQWSRRALMASKSLVDKMIENSDPRLNRVFITQKYVQLADLANKGESYAKVAPNGNPIQDKNTYNLSIFGFAQSAQTQLLSYHEILFLKAEAMQRLGEGSAVVEPVLKAAVVAAVVNAEQSINASLNSALVKGATKGVGIVEKSDKITATAAANYFDTKIKGLFQANPLKVIANQKYIAFFGASGESTEMYNDIRRWKSNGENLVELKNPGKFPLRLPYGNDDTTTNPNVQAAYGDGGYVYTENVWWAGGTR
jgi:hypothetical protein